MALVVSPEDLGREVQRLAPRDYWGPVYAAVADRMARVGPDNPLHWARATIRLEVARLRGIEAADAHRRVSREDVERGRTDRAIYRDDLDPEIRGFW